MLPPRERQKSRHRAVEQPRSASKGGPDQLGDHDVELDSYLAALSPEAHATETTGKFGSAQVFQLRLPAMRIEQLRRLAEERGVSPGALAVDWVIERLDHEDTPTGPLPVVEAPRKKGLRRLGRH
ncbi:hypothetical protein [Pseudonocardia sp. TRM90224]|uniref:hypothetical protein n=1 Tax=Pseudonocardia sp. TRM90224 TaxID=2812678 RepID=UPI001E34803C|nr:hypothetical protein [Pseudonocardia sp. TRM90224]